MNIFLPYETDVKKSVESLDDVRLNKQILECKVMLDSILDNKKSGYIKHPVTAFYKNNPQFIAYYGFICCYEYCYRYTPERPRYRQFAHHKLETYFNEVLLELGMIDYISQHYKIVNSCTFTPYYMEGGKDSPNCIRTTENVSQLFQDKLCKKWKQDIEKGRPPKWTKRSEPEFWKSEKDYE